MQNIRGEWALRLLNQKTVNFDAVGGGYPGVTRDDVLNALSANKIKGFEFDYLLAYYNGVLDETALRSIALDVYIWAAGIANAREWKLIKGKEVLRPCAVMALSDELLIGLHRCTECKGVGVSKKGLACRVCAGVRVDPVSKTEIGNGFRKRKAVEYSAALGVSKSAWNETWKPRYEALRIELKNIIILSARKVSKTIDITKDFGLLEAV